MWGESKGDKGGRGCDHREARGGVKTGEDWTPARDSRKEQDPGSWPEANTGSLRGNSC